VGVTSGGSSAGLYPLTATAAITLVAVFGALSDARVKQRGALLAADADEVPP
jgi:hypothetical protein